MSKTAVGLFENPGVAELVVQDLDATAFPRKEIRVVAEPLDMPVTGVMSFPRTDFEVGLARELMAIGATEPEASAYTQGVRRGGTLVFATGSNEDVSRAADIMNLHGALAVEEVVGREPSSGGIISGNATNENGSSTETGRIRQPGGGARMFVW